MISAFGVEHGISKSFVNGKWVKATELSAKQARKVRSGGQWKKARGVSEADEKFRAITTSPEVKEFRQGAKGVKVDRSLLWGTGGMKHAGSGATIRIGSAKQGRSYVSGVAGSKPLARKLNQHEAEHALPKRSSYRLGAQILGNPKKLMREEARADWHAFGHYGNAKAPSGYATGARARAGKPGGKYKLGPADKEQLKRAGASRKDIKQFKVTNRQAAEGAAAGIHAQMPHYPNKPKMFDPYRKLQDDFKRRGVPQRPKTFKSVPDAKPRPTYPWER